MIAVGIGYIDEYVAEAFGLHTNGAVKITDLDGNSGVLFCIIGKIVKYYKIEADTLEKAILLAKFLSRQKESYSSSLLGATRLATRLGAS